MSIYGPGRPCKYNPSTGSGQKPPAKPGEYRIRNSDGELKYIGESCDLNRRMNQHIQSGKLSAGDTIEFKVASPDSTSQTRRLHEQQKIAQHNPPLNKSKGGEGRPAGN